MLSRDGIPMLPEYGQFIQGDDRKYTNENVERDT